MVSINWMIEETLRECRIFDALRRGEEVSPEEVYAAYELRVDTMEDPRLWFDELR